LPPAAPHRTCAPDPSPAPCPSLDFLPMRNQTQLRCNSTSAEYEGTIPALVLLATLLLTQARMSLAFLATWAHTGSSSAAVDQHLQVLFPWATFQPL
uniref:Uncharacterized protein n=1 Tax=Serinus canaria TaxID=9135 RepID=A0A8C9NFZ9_SERCA